MASNSEIIQRFYSAFAQCDWKTMQSCYDDNIQFSDPVFPNLTGKQAKGMWHMLTESAQNFSLTFGEIDAHENKVTCRWEARYDFSKTGRKVHNRIHAEFTFENGKIKTHIDHFNLWRWSRMALGWPGLLLGWTTFVQRGIQEKAQKSLNKFIENHPEYL